MYKVRTENGKILFRFPISVGNLFMTKEENRLEETLSLEKNTKDCVIHCGALEQNNKIGEFYTISQI